MCNSSKQLNFGLTIVLAFIFNLIFFGPNLLADSRKIAGLIFEVDRIERVDSKTTRLVINSRERLVSPEQLDSVIVKDFFADSALSNKLTLSQIGSYLENVVQIDGESKYELAYPALTALAHRAITEFEGVKAVIENLAKLPAAREFFIVILMRGDGFFVNREFTALILFWASFDDVSWLASSREKYLFGLEDYIAPLCKNYLKQGLRSDQFDFAERVVVLSRNLLGAENDEYLQIESIFNRAKRALKIAEAGKLESLNEILGDAKPNSEIGDILAPIVTRALHGEAVRLIESGDVVSALGVLAEIQIDRRTNTTHELILEALKKLSPSNSPPIDNIRVRLFLRAIADNDLLVRRALFEVVEKQLLFFEEDRQLDRAEGVFELLSKLAEGQAERVHALGIQLARSYLLNGEAQKAKELITSLRGLSIGEHISLVFAGLYVSRKLMILVVSLVAVFLIWLVARRLNLEEVDISWAKNWGGRLPKKEEMQSEELQDDEVKPTFATLRSHDPELQEYVKCLSVLGLTLGCSDKEIKVAYRNLVKELHPDAHLEADKSELSTDNSRFIELTKCYDRAVEIYKLRFGSN